jgi:hypothetical protein
MLPVKSFENKRFLCTMHIEVITEVITILAPLPVYRHNIEMDTTYIYAYTCEH